MTSVSSYTILFKQQKNEEQVERENSWAVVQLRFSSLFGRLALNLKEHAVKFFLPVGDDVCGCVCLK